MPEPIAPTKTDTKLANSVVPESKAAVWRIVVSAGIALLAAAAEIASTVVPDLVNTGIALIPAGYMWAIPAIKIGAASLAAWLLKTAKKKHNNSVVSALNTEAPPGMNQYYGQ